MQPDLDSAPVRSQQVGGGVVSALLPEKVPSDPLSCLRGFWRP